MDKFKGEYSTSWTALQYLDRGGYGKLRADHMDRQRMHDIFQHLLDDGLTTETKSRVIAWLNQNPIVQDGK